MIDHRVHQVQRELTVAAAEKQRRQLFMVMGILVLLAGSVYFFSSPNQPDQSLTGQAISAPADAHCACTDGTCSGMIPETVGSFVVGEPKTAPQSSCEDSANAKPATRRASDPVLILLGEKCTVQGLTITFMSNGQINTFTSSCIDKKYQTIQQSKSFGRFACAGTNLNLFVDRCDCRDGAYGACLDVAKEPIANVKRPKKVPQ